MNFEIPRNKELEKKELDEQIAKLKEEVRMLEEEKKKDKESRKAIAESLGKDDIPYRYGNTSLSETKQRLIELKKEREKLEN